MRLKVDIVLPPPLLKRSFVVATSPSNTFEEILHQAQDRYALDYGEADRSVTTVDGYSIDLRDKAEQIFEPFRVYEDPIVRIDASMPGLAISALPAANGPFNPMVCACASCTGASNIAHGNVARPALVASAPSCNSGRILQHRQNPALTPGDSSIHGDPEWSAADDALLTAAIKAGQSLRVMMSNTFTGRSRKSLQRRRKLIRQQLQRNGTTVRQPGQLPRKQKASKLSKHRSRDFALERIASTQAAPDNTLAQVPHVPLRCSQQVRNRAPLPSTGSNAIALTAIKRVQMNDARASHYIDQVRQREAQRQVLQDRALPENSRNDMPVDEEIVRDPPVDQSGGAMRTPFVSRYDTSSGYYRAWARQIDEVADSGDDGDNDDDDFIPISITPQPPRNMAASPAQSMELPALTSVSPQGFVNGEIHHTDSEDSAPSVGGGVVRATEPPQSHPSKNTRIKRARDRFESSPDRSVRKKRPKKRAEGEDVRP